MKINVSIEIENLGLESDYHEFNSCDVGLTIMTSFDDDEVSSEHYTVQVLKVFGEPEIEFGAYGQLKGVDEQSIIDCGVEGKDITLEYEIDTGAKGD